MPKSKRCGTTQRFRSKTTFRNWLRRNNYTKDAAPGTWVYNLSGVRIGAAYTRRGMVEVDFY